MEDNEACNKTPNNLRCSTVASTPIVSFQGEDDDDDDVVVDDDVDDDDSLFM